MRKIMTFILAILLALNLAAPAFAAEFSVDETVRLEGMARSWYQGYEPAIQYDKMTLFLPLRAEHCTGDIAVSIALEDPHAFLLTQTPKEATVSPMDGIYPVKLTLSLERYRQNGDFPATITVKGTDANGSEVVESIPYIIRIRDGYGSQETLQPELSGITSNLSVGSEGSITLTITNPSTSISMTEGVLTVAESSGSVLMCGSNQFALPEILPGASETVTVPMIVQGNTSIRHHSFAFSLSYTALGQKRQWVEEFTLPVTQAIRLEQGGVQLPNVLAGDIGTMTLPVMNMGKGDLSNVLVTLAVEGVLDAQSVLVGTLAPGETKQAKLTFTAPLDALGTYASIVSITCEDAYGNQSAQTLETTLTVEKPIPVEDIQQEAEETAKVSPWIISLIVLCVLLTAALVAQGLILSGKLHKLEEEQL